MFDKDHQNRLILHRVVPARQGDRLPTCTEIRCPFCVGSKLRATPLRAVPFALISRADVRLVNSPCTSTLRAVAYTHGTNNFCVIEAGEFRSIQFFFSAEIGPGVSVYSVGCVRYHIRLGPIQKARLLRRGEDDKIKRYVIGKSSTRRFPQPCSGTVTAVFAAENGSENRSKLYPVQLCNHQTAVVTPRLATTVFILPRAMACVYVGIHLTPTGTLKRDTLTEPYRRVQLWTCDRIEKRFGASVGK